MNAPLIPPQRLTLRAQPFMARQVALFAVIPDPPAETPCEHPEGAWQGGLFGGDPVYCCTFCGAGMPEPERLCGLCKHPEHRKAGRVVRCRQCPPRPFMNCYAPQPTIGIVP